VRKTLPVNMMLEGRTALVVGGGRVGQRKVELLLDAGASVRLVCPDCVLELSAMSDAGKIVYAQKEFSPDDLDGVSVVFACTDDKHVNRAVLDAARRAKVLCCCADGNWADGDFVTPAVVRSGDFLLAVSTNGKSCRQSRLIKENLRRHIDAIESSELLVIGTSHECLSAERRAPFQLPLPQREAVGDMIRQVWGVHEFFILNTCNRVEVVAAISREAGTSGILGRILRFDQLPMDCYYVKRGFEAFSHICRVVAGMDSQTPGEFHVVAQFKDAVSEAETFGWAGPIIHDLGDAAMHVSKAIRHVVEPLLEVAEIEDVALRYLDFVKKARAASSRVLVIGTGVVGHGLVDGLMRRGCSCVWAYHEHLPDVKPEFASRIKVIKLGAIPDVLRDVDAVVSAVPVEEPLLTRSCHTPMLNPKGILFIDLGMPHNIDPALDGGNTVVVGLDELKNWFRKGNGSLSKADALCSQALEEHREFYDRILASIRGE
jgi:precorrin-2 dehydrogenase/sirohydrochlorin ferrochelatase